MRRSIFAACACTIAVVGLGAVPGTSSAAVSGQDVTFMNSAHQSNMAEIAAGEDAQRHGGSSCVKDVGAMLVRDHKKLDAALSDLAEKEGVTLAADVTPEQEAELKSLQSKAGGDGYDKAWLAAQENAHKKTLLVIDAEIQRGQDPDVQAAAREARPVVSAHLDMVRGGQCHHG
ncbi:DUF4142 domain-containing protein [Streptomyces toxytricini]|uniref:DUF4142 domain-containing protein n=1 Tax=Streptomyces toxytricini TaxID=67369 RepID=UPI00341E2311